MNTEYNPGPQSPIADNSSLQCAHECPTPELEIEGENVLRPKIMIRCCIKCKQQLPVELFYFKKSNLGFSSSCKECTKTAQRQYNRLKKSEISDNKQRYWNENKAALKERRKTHQVDHKKRKEKYREWERLRLKSDLNYRLKKNLRRRLHHALHGKNGSPKTIRLLGCNIDDLKTYLESKFLPGMSWDNYGMWEIDHIVPLSKVDLSNAAELQRVCHVDNLQPLWKRDNILKGNKL